MEKRNGTDSGVPWIKCKQMTEEQYRAAPGVNKSTLWELRKSPSHYKYCLEHPNKDTPALRFGRALHMAILQPEEFGRHYVIAPNIDRRTKDGREQYQAFVDGLGDREIITVDDYEQISEMYKAVYADKDAVNLLQGCQTETPIFWTDPDTRIRCKCRLDAVKPGVIVDVKSCADASTKHFVRDAMVYGYDVQCAHYTRGYRSQHDEQPEFWFLCIEKTPPYAINLIEAGDLMERGTLLLNDLLSMLLGYRKHRNWSRGYGTNRATLSDWDLIPDDD